MWVIYIGPVLAIIFLLLVIAFKDTNRVKLYYHDDPMCPGHTMGMPSDKCNSPN